VWETTRRVNGEARTIHVDEQLLGEGA
jgi:hypothetical protein